MGRLNLMIPEKLNKRLDEYCLKVAQRNGRIPHGIKSIIGRMALREWLDKHENDLTIKFEETP